MQQNRTSRQFPSIKYQDDHSSDPYASPRIEEPASARINYLEDRLAQQERTTANLLERAFKIKKDVIESLNITHGTWQEEKDARELLQAHISTITDVVKKLNRDIEHLENQIQARDSATFGTQNTVKNLEINHVAGVTDLRGRVVRCDASIARLAADLKTTFDAIKMLSQQQQDLNTKTVDRLHNLDARIHEMRSVVEKHSSEHSMHLKQIETGTSHQLSGLDVKTRSMSDDMKHFMKSIQASEHNEREKLEARILLQMEKALAHRDSKLEKVQHRIEEGFSAVDVKMMRQQDENLKEHERRALMQETFEKRLRDSIDSSLYKQNEELSRTKSEMRTGFATVQESITEMKELLDGKRKLLEEQLRKEMSQLRKMVVLV